MHPLPLPYTCIDWVIAVNTITLRRTVQVCWVTNTYYVPEGSPIGMQPGAIKYYISYYQWVPVVLLVQAFLFYSPCLLWRVFSERSGININNLVEAADTIQNALYPERREKTIKSATFIIVVRSAYSGILYRARS